MADVTVTANNVRPLPGATVMRFRAGAALTVGQAVYVVSDSAVAPADADSAASAQAIGIVVSAAGGKTAAAAGESVDVVVTGGVTGFSNLTPGALLYTSTTAGALNDARPAAGSGDYVWIVGRAINATSVHVAPFTDSFAAQ